MLITMRGITAVITLSLLASFAFGDGDELFRQGAAAFQSAPETAYPLFIQAAEAGNISGMVGAGHCLENGIGTKQDYAGAIEWYEKAVLENNLKACEALARIYASCPDPQFHDGEKAVKYAEALARKNPKDPGVLALLAAAHARNMDFEQASEMAGKAAGYEHRAGEKIALETLKQQCKQGEPIPAVACDDWLLRAAEQGSLWAIKRIVPRMDDPQGPLYDSQKAFALCQNGIRAGYDELHALMAKLYLHDGNLEKAHEHFEIAHKCWEKKCEDAGRRRDGEPPELPPVEVRYYSLLRIRAQKVSWRRRIGFQIGRSVIRFLEPFRRGDILLSLRMELLRRESLILKHLTQKRV